MKMQAGAWDLVAHDIDFNLNIDTKGLQNTIRAESRILDFGCGYGRNCNLLSNIGYSNIVGVDTSQKMIARGLQEYPHLTLAHCDGEQLQHLAKHFDCVLTCGVFTCIPQQELRDQVIIEILRVLKIGGIFHMVEFYSEPSRSFKSSMGIEMQHSSQSQWKDLLTAFETIGFNTVETNTLSGKAANAISFFGRRST